MASEIILCRIFSDIDDNYAQIVVDFDLEDKVINHIRQDSYENNQLSEVIDISFSELNNGVVLDSEGSYKTVILRSENFKPNLGGRFFLDTLYSGISGKRKQYPFDLIWTTKGPQLTTDNQPFSKMLFLANRSVLFGVVGIEKIQFQK